MAQFNIINFSEFKKENNSLRLDAEFFKLNLLESEEIIKKIKFDYLKNLNIKNTRYKQPIYDINSDIIILNSQFIKDSELIIENAKKGNNQLVPYNSVLINSTGVGTLGRVNINYYNDKKISVDSHVNVIVTKPKLNPKFLMIFLKCKYGQNQINRRFKGSSGQIEIYPSDFDEFLIPLINSEFQKKISLIVDDLFSKQIKSKLIFQEAEQILLELLNLKDYKPKHELSFDANLNEVLNSKRIDSEYYQPKYKIVEEKIRKVKHDTLGKLFDFVKGFEVGGDAYQEEGIPYLRVSNLEVLELDWSNPKFISEELFNQLKENHQPQKGEILLSKDGTPGIAYFVRDDIKSINSSGILRLKLKENKKVNLSYMTLVLNSILIQQQINRDSGGAIIKHWRPEEVKNTLVPILDDETQKKIASKLDESYKLRKESKELLEKAKKMVEKEIEKEAK